MLLHFTAFDTDYKMLATPRTPASTLLEAWWVAMARGLICVPLDNREERLQRWLSKPGPWLYVARRSAVPSLRQ